MTECPGLYSSKDKHIEVAQIVEYHRPSNPRQQPSTRLSEELFAFLDSYKTKCTSKEKLSNIFAS